MLAGGSTVFADEAIDVWPVLAPGEVNRNAGTPQPPRPNENPVVTRVVDISRPTFTVHLADKPNGTAAIILPGGGFAKVVPDKEGTEAAEWLKRHGVSAFVLSYRTTQPDESKPGWMEPLQDVQRTIAIVRSRAEEWKLDPNRIGIVAFSAGGQVGARLLSDGAKKSYEAVDAIDSVSHRPDFAILVYPWRLYDEASDSLVEGCRSHKGLSSNLSRPHSQRSVIIARCGLFLCGAQEVRHRIRIACLWKRWARLRLASGEWLADFHVAGSCRTLAWDAKPIELIDASLGSLIVPQSRRGT